MDSFAIEIAEAIPSDCPQAVELLERQLDEHNAPLADGSLERALEALLRRPDHGRLLVARCGKQVVGVAIMSFLWNLEDAWLDELYVDAAFRGRGIGQQLVERALQVARERGCEAMDLGVDPGHDAAERPMGGSVSGGIGPHAGSEGISGTDTH